MKLIPLFIFIVGLSVLPISAQENCMNPESLKKLDATWEKALLELNLDFLETTLSEDFIWVHTHAVKTDDRNTLLAEVKNNLSSTINNTRSRISRDVKVIISGTTGVVTGFTTVDRGPSPTTYNFMRTYVQSEGKCYLLANHTMAIP